MTAAKELIVSAQKHQAVAHYVATGSGAKTAKSVGVDKSTISRWRKTEWWARLELEAKIRFGTEQQARMRQILVETHEQLLDRVRHGDTQLVKGEPQRVPMKGRDLAVTQGIVFDKLQISLGQPTTISAKEKTLEERALEFQRIGEKYGGKGHEQRSPALEGEIAKD